MFTRPVLQVPCIWIVQRFLTSYVSFRQAYHADIKKLATLGAAATMPTCLFPIVNFAFSQAHQQQEVMEYIESSPGCTLSSARDCGIPEYQFSHQLYDVCDPSLPDHEQEDKINQEPY